MVARAHWYVIVFVVAFQTNRNALQVHPIVYKHLDEKLSPLSNAVSRLEYKDSDGRTDETSTKIWLRLSLLKEYLKKLDSSVASGDLDRRLFNEDKFTHLVDRMLLGTGSQRLQGSILNRSTNFVVRIIPCMNSSLRALWTDSGPSTKPVNVLHFLGPRGGRMPARISINEQSQLGA